MGSISSDSKEKKDKNKEIKNEIITKLNNLKSKIKEIKEKIIINKEIIKIDENKNKLIFEIVKEYKNDFEYILNEFSLNKNKEKELNNNSIEIKEKIDIPKNIEIKSKIKENKRIINISNIIELDYFTSKDIEIENKKITSEIYKEAFKQINDNDEIKNESIAKFLRDIAYISRKSFIKSKEILALIIKDYGNCLGENFILDVEENKKKLSSFIKNNNCLYEQYFMNNKIHLNNKQKLLEELFIKLSILYFHCQLAFPSIEINFKMNENEYNQEIMIDFLNYGKGKINFVFLPSLYSNDNFLKNAKFWVYTYNENEFYFNDISDYILNEILK